MQYEVIGGARLPIKAWTRGVQVEDEAKRQLINVANMPFIHKHVAVMPDVHFGIGATVGSVIATKGAIIPAAVGVDIGCGMNAVRTSLTASDLPDSLLALRHQIERDVPVGFNQHKGDKARELYDENDDLMGSVPSAADDLIQDYCKTAGQLGTLGGGNHFIELCLDEEQRVWVMLHSGSRGIGNQIGRKFIDIAKRKMEQQFVQLADKDLAYLCDGTPEYEDYADSVDWAQQYALRNRKVMMKAVLDAMDRHMPGFRLDGEAVNCHHNYISHERHFGENVHVTRKGAVDAHEGVLGIIPGSMGAKSFIVRGLGNRESFCSCSHGAGRAMSRTAARKAFTLDQHKLAVQGVECRVDADVIDETPGAYKDIDAVMAAQSELVSIEHTLKQVLCVKG